MTRAGKRTRLIQAISLAVVLALVAPAPLEAGVGSDMTQYFDDMGAAANVTGPTAYQGQSAGYYTLGSMWARFPQKTVYPADLQLPKVNAGCGGIDVFAGSFSFINADQFVALAKAVANNAIGFAFQLAMESISPQIAGVIKYLQNIAKDVNNFNINSCEAAAAAVGSIWPRVDKAEDRICQSIGTSAGRFGDWAKARHGCGPGGERASTVNGNADAALKAQQPTDKNYAWDMIKASPLQTESQETRELIMNLTGTVVVRARASDNDPVTIEHIGPGDTAMLDALLDGTQSIRIKGCSDPDKCLSLVDKTITPLGTNALKPKITAMIQDIGTRIRADQAATPAERNLLGITSVPLYKIIAVNEAQGLNLSLNEMSNLGEVVAVEVLDGIVQHTLDQAISGSSGNVKQADEAMLSQFRSEAYQARQRLGERLGKLQSRANLTYQIVDRAMVIEGTLRNKLAPGLSAALNFSRGLSAQGVR